MGSKKVKISVDLTPNRGNVVIQRESITEKDGDAVKLAESGLFIPTAESEVRLKDNHTAILLAIGPNRLLDTGREVEFPFSVGDRVVVSPFPGTKYRYIDADREEAEVEVIEQSRIVARIG